MPTHKTRATPPISNIPTITWLGGAVEGIDIDAILDHIIDSDDHSRAYTFEGTFEGGDDQDDQDDKDECSLFVDAEEVTARPLSINVEDLRKRVGKRLKAIKLLSM